MYPEITAEQSAYGLPGKGQAVETGLGERLTGMTTYAANISATAESVRGRLFGYGPTSSTVGSGLKEVSPDTIEDTVNRLAGVLANLDSTISLLNSRL